MISTAYRWEGEGSVHWLFVEPSGRHTGGWSPTTSEANRVIGDLARASGCALTVVVPRHPNEHPGALH